MTPLLLSQNYHLAHHINPAVPFYLLARTWKQFEPDYLDRKVPISTAWGSRMTPTEYREWRGRTAMSDPEAVPGRHI
jgi:beta-carotene hydroxylase